jgi:hypothetical protein
MASKTTIETPQALSLFHFFTAKDAAIFATIQIGDDCALASASTASAVVSAELPQNGLGRPAPVTHGLIGQDPSACCAASTAAMSLLLGFRVPQSHCMQPMRAVSAGSAVAIGGSVSLPNPARRAAWAIVEGAQ